MTTKKEKPMFVNLRLHTAAEKKLIADILKATQQSTNSGALMQAGSMYLDHSKTILRITKENETLQKQLQEANRILNLSHTYQTNLAGYSKKFLSGKHVQRELWED
jgi:hypothetical protein